MYPPLIKSKTELIKNCYTIHLSGLNQSISGIKF